VRRRRRRRQVLMVFVYLCEETRELVQMAETNFFPTLMIFGESAMPQEDLVAGDGERRMGRMLPFLQELSNFVDRCYSIALNAVQQLSSLYKPKRELYKTTFKNIKLLPVYRWAWWRGRGPLRP
jgi:WASH complex subunit 7